MISWLVFSNVRFRNTHTHTLSLRNSSRSEAGKKGGVLVGEGERTPKHPDHSID